MAPDPVANDIPLHDVPASGTDETPSKPLQADQPPPKSLRDHQIDYVTASLKPDDNASTDFKDVENASIATLLEMTSKPVIDTDDQLHLFFLPSIHIDKSERKPGSVALLDDPKICDDLKEALKLESFFLTKDGWDSNGFLTCQKTLVNDKYEMQAFTTRCLIKILTTQKTSNVPDYSWLFLSFSILWAKCRESGQVSCVVVCFDHFHDDPPYIYMKQKVLDGLRDYPRQYMRAHCLAVYDAFMKVIVWEYDRALWLFRKPVRNIEKNRKKFATDIPKLKDSDPGDNQGITAAFEEMHELSRHIVHMSETIQAVAKVVASALHHIQSREDQPITTNIISGLGASARFLEGLKLRSDAFRDRLDNEIQFAFNIVSVHHLRDTQSLLRESSKEGQELIQFVTFLTSIFLPPTFAVGCWGMNFFELKESRLVFSPDLWYFFVSCLVMLMISFALWQGYHIWHSRRNRPSKKKRTPTFPTTM